MTSCEYEWRDPEPTCAADYLLPCVLALLRDLPPPARILDVGCGNGFLAGRLSSLGYLVVGIDSSPTGIRIARSAQPQIRFEVLHAEGNLLEKLDEPPFDVVVSTEVIEHVYDPAQLGHACFDAIRPGGWFICSTPYHGYFKNLALAATNRFDRHWNPLQPGGHVKFWSRRTLARLLIAVGFRDIEFHGAGRLPFLWKSMVMTARKPD